MRRPAIPLVSFFRELRQRRVYHAVAIYLAGAFVVLQGSDLLIKGFHLPDWVLTALIVLALFGLFLAATLAWMFDLTPQGVRRAAAAQPAASRPRPARMVLLTGGLVLLGAFGFAAVRRVERMTPKTTTSIAVLPFTNFGGSADDEYLADGLTEDVLTQLAKAGGLRVISRTSVMQYKRTQKSVRAIGSELSVTHVLEGSLRRTGDRMRVTAQLIDARTDEHVWAESYDRTAGDLLALQSELAERIARALRIGLSSEERQRIRATPTENAVAYDLYQRARQRLYEFDAASNEIAIDLARKALSIDPEFARAYALLGTAFAFKVRIGQGSEWGDSGMVAAQRAVTLDPQLADGHLALGNAYLRLGRYAEALRSYERAARLNPSDWRAFSNMAVVHSYQGRPVEALRSTRRALTIDPRSPWISVAYQNIAAFYLDLSLPDRATEAVRKALETQRPDHPQILTMQIGVALQRAEYSRARALADKLGELVPTDASAQLAAGDAYLFSGDLARAAIFYQRGYALSRSAEGVRHFAPALLGYVLLRQGSSARAAELFAEMDSIGKQEIASGHENYSVYLSLAACAVLSGDTLTALRHVERAIASSGVAVEWTIFHDVMLAPLRSNARYQRIQADLRARGDELREQVRREAL